MIQKDPVANLLTALDASIVQLEACLRSGRELPCPGILPARRRATAMLRAAMRYGGWGAEHNAAPRHGTNDPCSESVLWKAERQIVDLYREAILRTPPDAAEYRLLCEQCAVAEQDLLQFGNQANEWTAPENLQVARHA